MVVAGAALAMVSAHVASGAPAPPVDRGGAQSVRPTTPEIRTSVGPLLGWQVGIFSNVFPSLTFTESAVLADALGLGKHWRKQRPEGKPGDRHESGLSSLAGADRHGEGEAQSAPIKDGRLPGR